MNSKVTGEKPQISGLLSGLVLACADDANYVCRRLARLAAAVFDDVVTRYSESEHDLFDVLAVLNAMAVHPEATIAQRAIIEALLVSVEAFVEGPNNPADVAPEPAPSAATTAPTAQQLDYGTLLENGGEVSKAMLGAIAGDIEACAGALFEQAHNVEFEGEVTAGALIRTYASRIKALNSLTLSYLGPDSITLDDAFTTIHGADLGTELLTRQLEQARGGAPVETAAPVAASSDADYLAGVRLAHALVRQGTRMSNDHPVNDDFNLMSEYRRDESAGIDYPQNNWTLSAVRKLTSNPALAEGFAAVLSDAFACYDVDLPLYKVQDLTLAKIKGPGGKAVTSAITPEQDYMEGFRLALDIVKVGKEFAVSDSDRCELQAKYRGGAEQENFALSFIDQLAQLAEFPALLEGFAAVLSNVFAAQVVPGPEELEALTYFDIHRPLTAEQAAALVEEESKAQDAAHAASTAAAKADKPAKTVKPAAVAKPTKAISKRAKTSA